MTRMLDMVPRFNTVFAPRTSLMHRFLDNWMTPDLFREECDWLPPSDITDTDTAFHVTMELPGIDMKDMDISFTGDILTVKGEKSRGTLINESFFCEERYFGSFQRSFRIPGKIDQEHIEANYKDGVLKITLNKSGESVVKKIEVH